MYPMPVVECRTLLAERLQTVTRWLCKLLQVFAAGSILMVSTQILCTETQDDNITSYLIYSDASKTVRVNTRVVNINTESKSVSTINETGPTMENEVFTYDQLIIAVGSVPLKPPIPGINRDGLFALRNLQDMDDIVAWLNGLPVGGEKHHAVVAGAGFVGLEMVEQLMRRGLDVTVVEMLPQVLGPLDVEMAAIIEEDMKKKGVSVVTGDAIEEFLPAAGEEHGTIVKLKSGKMLPPAAVTILGMGVRPDTQVIREAGIECGPRGHIIVDDYLRTNVPDVWAAGDAVEVRNPIVGNEEKWAVPLAGVSRC
jgi:NADPH-dependent 2,4-dienoyl-CoA reductase/sulfur reductase-like enzyme